MAKQQLKNVLGPPTPAIGVLAPGQDDAGRATSGFP